MNKTISKKKTNNSLQLGITRYNEILKEACNMMSPRQRDAVQWNNVLNYLEVVDEVCCYIQRTFQILDLYTKIGVFDKGRAGILGDLPKILKDYSGFGINMIKLNSRLKLSTYMITQLGPED